MVCETIIRSWELCKDIGLIFACFRNNESTSKRKIYLWESHFEKFGTVENLNSKSANRECYLERKKILDEALISRVKEGDENSPKWSTRKMYQMLGISRTTLRRVLIKGPIKDSLILIVMSSPIESRLSRS